MLTSRDTLPSSPPPPSPGRYGGKNHVFDLFLVSIIPEYPGGVPGFLPPAISWSSTPPPPPRRWEAPEMALPRCLLGDPGRTASLPVGGPAAEEPQEPLPAGCAAGLRVDRVYRAFVSIILDSVCGDAAAGAVVAARWLPLRTGIHRPFL